MTVNHQREGNRESRGEPMCPDEHYFIKSQLSLEFLVANIGDLSKRTLGSG